MHNYESYTEERVSLGLFKASLEDPSISVVSWQAVDGKGYFTSDIKFRLQSGKRLEPDLIIAGDKIVWLIEVKSLHTEALADEVRLDILLSTLKPKTILETIKTYSSIDVHDKEVVACVVFGVDDIATNDYCTKHILHIEWQTCEERIGQTGLSNFLNELEKAKHDLS